MTTQHNQNFRYGSAAWADSYQVGGAGLFQQSGPQVGFLDGRPLFLYGDAPLITIGGAGSGKLRDLLGYVVCASKGQRMIALDPRGELSAISMAAHTRNDEYAYTWNPLRLHGMAQHSCNPLDILDGRVPTFHADCKFIAEALIPLSGAGEGKYFELRARDWTEALIKSDVEVNGTTSLPRLIALINLIETDPQSWADQLERMLASAHESVRRVAGEMLTKQQDSPREFGSILGEIYAHLGFLDDPVLLQSLQGGDLSLREMTDATRVRKVFLNVPAEYLSIWSPLIRLFMTVTMLYKARAPQAQRIMLLVDEAGQLGRFEALLRAFTYGRGAGIRAWAIFQDVGQIVRHFGAPALQGFLGSAQMRQFFGVRDYETAKLVSDMLGPQTLEYDDPKLQQAAQHKKTQAAKEILQGGDLTASVIDLAHYSKAAQRKTKQARQLMTPDEVLAMPEDKQVLFISSKNLPPIFAEKYPYYERKEMAGQYLPNPYHPPADKVPIKCWRGKKWVRVIRERVPGKYSSFPQYKNGMWDYVVGYKPN